MPTEAEIQQAAARRRWAEARAADLGEPDFTALSPAEIRDQFHELRIHQIELAIQNEELHRAQVALEKAQSAYLALYDLAPVGYVALSEQGLLVDANPRATLLLGAPRKALLQQPLSRFIHPVDQDLFYLQRRQLFLTGKLQVGELRLVPEGAHAGVIWVRLEQALASHDGEHHNACHIIFSDITERKAGEAALRAMTAVLSQVTGGRRSGLPPAGPVAGSAATSELLPPLDLDVETPAQGIAGMADLLLRGGLGGEQRRLAEAIRSSAAALL